MKYGFSEDAIADLDEICDYLGSRSVNAASKLFDRIRQKFYGPDCDGIEILRVISGYRDLRSVFELD